MLYIDINKEIAINNAIYNLTYIDFPYHAFVKRISKQNNKNEIGIDFSDKIYFYENDNIINDKNQMTVLLNELKQLDIFTKIIKKCETDAEVKIVKSFSNEFFSLISTIN